jgi:polyhydroxybutyrate depolymerase
MQNAANMFRIHELWPEAIVVYPQGVNTPGRLTDPEGKRPGWQMAVGDQSDRDLKFFDAMFEAVKAHHRVNTNRVYATGHSNGGAFSYLLWEARPKFFTAFAPSAALLPDLVGIRINPHTRAIESIPAKKSAFVPKPVLHLAGQKDPLVKFEWQKAMIDAVRKKSGCAEGKPWEINSRCTIYPSKSGGDVIAYIHGGTHNFPNAGKELIVAFFKGYQGETTTPR